MKSKKLKVKRQNYNSNFKIILKLLTLTLCFLLFSFYFLLDSSADTSFAEVERLFLEGQYEKCASAAHAVIGSRPRKGYEIYYLKGLSELKINRFKDARQSFQAIFDKYPASPRLFDARVGMGDSYLLEGKKDDALKIYDEILRKYPADDNIVIVKSRIKECGLARSAREDPEIMPRDIPREESKRYISVQVGSFKNSRNADKLARKLSSEGYDSFVEIPAGAPDKLYRVRVGRLPSIDSAEALAARLKAKGYTAKVCPAR